MIWFPSVTSFLIQCPIYLLIHLTLLYLFLRKSLLHFNSFFIVSSSFLFLSMLSPFLLYFMPNMFPHLCFIYKFLFYFISFFTVSSSWFPSFLSSLPSLFNVQYFTHSFTFSINSSSNSFPSLFYLYIFYLLVRVSFLSYSTVYCIFLSFNSLSLSFFLHSFLTFFVSKNYNLAKKLILFCVYLRI